jgi:macrolide transport system ATP-binding/permease protein
MRVEHWWYTIPLRIKSIFRRGRAEQELQDELQFHLDELIADGLKRGLSPDAARQEALRTMGGLEQRKEEMRDARGIHVLTDFVDDVRFAIRSLRRAGGMAFFIVITLALGIGITAASFSMVDALVFRPYAVPDPDRVVTLVSRTRDNPYAEFSYREYLDLRARAQSYDGLIAHGTPVPVGFGVENGRPPQVQSGLLVSGNYFRVLGVEPRLGRSFRDDEDRVPGRDAVVVIGRDCWKREFQSDPGIVGRTIQLNGRAFTVIGVAPESFPGLFIFSRPDFYVPLAMQPLFATSARDFFEDRGVRQLYVKGRLKRDVSIDQARSETAVIAQDWTRAHPETNRHREASVLTTFEIRTRADDANWKFGVVFNVLALAVLLVACTNVAGLLLSRAGTRTREIAVRLAMGAGRFRIVRLLLTESLILALLGGLAGVVVGYITIELLGTFSIPTTLPVVIPFRLDLRVLFACMALSVGSALLFGLAPALQSTRTDLVSGLKSADVDRPGRRRLWGRNALVVAQVCTSLMLLAASFLMLRGFERVVRGNYDFTHTANAHVLLATFDPRLLQYDAPRTEQFYEQLVARVSDLPGVRSAGLTTNPPLALGSFEALSFVPEGVTMPPERETFTVAMDTITEGYFETMAIALRSGRNFLPSDDADAPRVAIVNEHFARHYWPGADAVGRRIRIGGAQGMPVEIVGVAQDIRYRESDNEVIDFVYVPLAQNPRAQMTLLLRADGAPLPMLDPLEQVVRGLDPNLPIIETKRYEEIYRYSAVEGPGIAIKMVGTMGAVALVLALVGLYGIVAYQVARRTREIGIRMAVGAAPQDVLRWILSKGLVLVATGVVLGLGLGLAIERLMNAMLFNAGGVDLVVYAVVVPAMLLAATLAAWIPARRAARIEPTQALRYE